MRPPERPDDASARTLLLFFGSPRRRGRHEQGEGRRDKSEARPGARQETPKPWAMRSTAVIPSARRPYIKPAPDMVSTANRALEARSESASLQYRARSGPPRRLGSVAVWVRCLARQAHRGARAITKANPNPWMTRSIHVHRVIFSWAGGGCETIKAVGVRRLVTSLRGGSPALAMRMPSRS